MRSSLVLDHRNILIALHTKLVHLRVGQFRIKSIDTELVCYEIDPRLDLSQHAVVKLVR